MGETRVTPWKPFGHYGFSHVRIWAKQTEFGMWQRHEWQREDGSCSQDRWIPSGARQWLPGAELTTTEPNDFEALLAALARIAQGHNDPRTLAAETLAAIGSKP